MNGEAKDYDVVIVGAGWSGLLACKYCLAEGLNTVVLEARDRIGGVWAYTDDPTQTSVMETTRTTSSRCITEISDFPMPADYPDFPWHWQINSYLAAYCARYGLSAHIALNRPVARIRKTAGKWRIATFDGTEWTAPNIIVASGVHRDPIDVSDDPRFRNYSGKLVHSGSVKRVSREFTDETVVVWGGGESASDIASEASGIVNHIYFCIPNGQWFLPRVVDRWPPFPSARRKVVDHTSSRLRLLLSPTHQYAPLIYQYLEYAFGFNGHGQEAWRTAAPYQRSFVNKSSEVLAQLKKGKITPKRDVLRCDGKMVHFSDGTVARVDLIVTCSGYRASFPFFEDAIGADANQRDWFKQVFYDADPSLAFVGFVRPVIGSIPGIAELQSRYVAAVFSGKRRLPDPDARAKTIAADARFWNHHFRFTSGRLAGLVDHFIYCNQLAKLIGCYPNFGRLMLSNPKRWWKAVTAPWNGCQFWLNDRRHRNRIFETYRRYDDNRISQIYIFLVLAPLLPLVGLYTRARVLLFSARLGHRVVAPSRNNRP
jgi:dimethylaniline monooxygenase (N-oxide forming)